MEGQNSQTQVVKTKPKRIKNPFLLSPSWSPLSTALWFGGEERDKKEKLSVSQCLLGQKLI